MTRADQVGVGQGIVFGNRHGHAVYFRLAGRLALVLQDSSGDADQRFARLHPNLWAALRTGRLNLRQCLLKRVAGQGTGGGTAG